MSANSKDIFFQSEHIIIDFLALIDVTPEKIVENENTINEIIRNLDDFEKFEKQDFRL